MVMRWKTLTISVLVLAALFPACRKKSMDLPIGVLAELSGEYPVIGASSKNGAELAIASIDENGGVELGNKLYGLRLIIEDTGGKPDQAAAAAKRLIETEKVLAIIGPNISASALPAAEVAESAKVLMLTPSATSPKVTLDSVTGNPRKYVYRACFTDPFQGKILAKFAIDFMKKENAAVLYDATAEVPKDQAERFKKHFEESGGKVAAFEGYNDGEKDFSAYFKKIAETKPDFVFLPNYYNDVAVQVKQAREAGIQAPFLGSDDWSDPNLFERAGKDIDGSYHSAHYAPDAKVPSVAAFTELYKKRHQGEVPDDVAALTFDSVMLLKTVLKTATAPDREAIREAFSKVTVYEGVTGKMTFKPGTGDPEKSAVMVKIDSGKRSYVTSIEP